MIKEISTTQAKYFDYKNKIVIPYYYFKITFEVMEIILKSVLL